MKLGDYDISHPYSALLLSSERITPSGSGAEVRHLVLRLPDTGFDYVEGQSIGVLVPGPHPFGNKFHLRLYSIASSTRGESGAHDTISICVRRCFYIDDVSGEEYPGIASNYLCNSAAGDTVQITGPYGSHFSMPPDSECNMLMVGVGTGIAPFRAFVHRIYDQHGEWRGKVRLFYGAKTGMEMLYHNDQNKDLGLYYSQRSFKAFEAVSPRPHFDQEPAIDRLLIENQQEIWEMMNEPKTYVYLAGLEKTAEKFEKAMESIAGSKDAWIAKRHELTAQRRYHELLY